MNEVIKELEGKLEEVVNHMKIGRMLLKMAEQIDSKENREEKMKAIEEALEKDDEIKVFLEFAIASLKAEEEKEGGIPC